MIHSNSQHNIYIIIWISFIIASILQIIPYPLQLIYLPKPSWLNLLLIYWITELPNRINIGTGFLIGLITDVISGPILGIHAMTYSLIAYYLIIKLPLFCNMSCLKQTLIIIFLSFKIHIVVYLTNILIYPMKFYPEIILNSIIDGITWIAIFSIMRKFYTHNKIRDK